MWLMAKRKIENWIYWIIGDIITVPLYFYKGLTFSSILIFCINNHSYLWLFSMEKELKQNPSSCVKIVLFGPESSGKTTLATQLAAHFNAQWVPEYMRTYLELKWENSKKP